MPSPLPVTLHSRDWHPPLPPNPSHPWTRSPERDRQEGTPPSAEQSVPLPITAEFVSPLLLSSLRAPAYLSGAARAQSPPALVSPAAELCESLQMAPNTVSETATMHAGNDGGCLGGTCRGHVLALCHPSAPLPPLCPCFSASQRAGHRFKVEGPQRTGSKDRLLCGELCLQQRDPPLPSLSSTCSLRLRV